jgi:hypothetical protein
MLFIAYGIYSFVENFRKQFNQIFTTIVIIMIYCLSLANFMHIYFFQNPLQGYFDFSMRVLSRYIVSASKDHRVYIYTTTSNDTIKKFLFYSNQINSSQISNFYSQIHQTTHTFGNIIFSSCYDNIDTNKTSDVVIYDTNCGHLPNTPTKLTISALKDAGEKYAIYNDRLCNRYGLKDYPRDLKINEFLIEKITTQEFCQAFITH